MLRFLVYGCCAAWLDGLVVLLHRKPGSEDLAVFSKPASVVLKAAALLAQASACALLFMMSFS
jgi:hypothetical protein